MAQKSKKAQVWVDGDKDSNPNTLSDFYSDLDKKAKKKGCSLPLLITFMLVVLAAIIFSLFYLKNNFELGLNYFNKTDLAGYGDGIVSKLDEEIKDIPAESPAVVTFTEDELSYFLGVDEKDFPLKKAKLNIKTSGIVISGRTRDSYISIPVSVVFKPVVKDGKFKIEIDTLQGSFVTLPKVIKDGLNSSIDDVVNKKSSAINNFEFRDVVLKEGTLELIGTKKSL